MDIVNCQGKVAIIKQLCYQQKYKALHSQDQIKVCQTLKDTVTGRH